MAVLLGTKPGTDNGADFEAANFVFGCSLVAAATGTIDTISIVLDAANTNAGTISAAVFTDVTGTPTARVGNTVSITAVSGAGTRTSAPGAAAAVTNGTTYWLTFLSNARFDFDLQNASAGTCKDGNNINAVMPATWPSVAATFTETMRVFAEDAGGVAVLGYPEPARPLLMLMRPNWKGALFHPQFPLADSGITAQTFAQAMDATAITITAAMQRQIGKSVTATSTTSASIVKQVGKFLTATSTTSASMVRQVGKALTANVAVTASLVAMKVILKALTATVTVTASMVKQVGKPLTATTVALSASIVKQIGKSLTATVAVSASMTAIRVILKALTATVTVTASMVLQVGKPLSATVTLTSSLVKQVGKRLTATVTTSATMSAIKVILRTLTATVTTSATMVRQIGKPLSATVTLSTSLVKQIAKRLTATVTVTATMSALRVFLRTLTATVTASATMTRQVGKGLVATVSVAATASKRVSKTLIATFTATASMLADPFIASAVIVTGYFRTAAAGVLSSIPGLSRFGTSPGGESTTEPNEEGFDPSNPGGQS